MLNIMYYISAVLHAIAHYSVLTSISISIENGTARQHNEQTFFARSARELLPCTLKIVVGPGISLN